MNKHNAELRLSGVDSMDGISDVETNKPFMRPIPSRTAPAKAATSSAGEKMTNETVVNSMDNTVSFSALSKQLLRGLPHFHKSLKGLLLLATVTNPDKKCSVGLRLEKLAAKYPTKTAILFEEKSYTYSEFNRIVNRYAHYLQSLGVVNGDSVAIMVENRPETLFTAFAAIKLGAVAAMINTTQRDSVLLHSLNVVKPKVLMIGEECLEQVENVLDQLPSEMTQQMVYVADAGDRVCPTSFIDLEVESKTCSTENLACTQEILLSQPCFYIFTSGTTGMPKASIMSHMRWYKAMYGIGMASMKLRQDDIFYVSLPFYHNNALTVSLSSVFSAGATIAIGRKFSVTRFWDDIRHYKATCFSYIGELLRYLMNTEPKSNDQDHNIRIIIGNGLRPDIWTKFKSRFGIDHIDEFYGASECSVIFTNIWNLDNTAGFLPLPFDVVQYDIEKDEPVRDANGFLKPVAKGEVGLLIVKVTDKAPFDGYTDKSANQKKVLRDVFEKGDLYYNSGDLVLKQGFKHIAFVDRLGDTFRWKGENVATTEVEAMINQHPEIKQSVVYGVSIPNTDGAAGMAALTLHDEVGKLDLPSFTKLLQEKLASYSVPIFLRIQTEHDITGTFKYCKGKLKKEAFSLDMVSEPLYFLPPKSDCYKLLDDSELSKITSGEYSF